MCGIAGQILFDRQVRVSAEAIQRMLVPMKHRGPDGNGVHVSGNVGLGHLRLSIIDLGGGAQPMANEDQSVWITFNGEIYNYRELRREMQAKGHVFRTQSDTEVIVHLYEELGADCVRKLRGMFAFAIWDEKRQLMMLARDRVGIKPLHYRADSRSLSFASELKGIVADPEIKREIHHAALGRFLAFNYVPGSFTLIKGIHKLLPGHVLTVQAGVVTTRPYWDLEFTKTRWGQPFEEAVEELQALLKETVQDHMMADVPVGLLLSGGVDSSAILSLAAGASEQRIRTFTVGFDDPQVVDERPYARMAATQYGTEHHEISISEQGFWDFLPSYVKHMEEPVCEPPAVALYYVSKLAREHVKVLLSGEGGDEAFAGYPNYSNMLRLRSLGARLGMLAKPAAAVARVAGRVMRDRRVERYGFALGRPLGAHYYSRTSGPTAFFNRHARHFCTRDLLKSIDAAAPMTYVSRLLTAVKEQCHLDQMLYVDTKMWLPDDLLVKADKMTMANSVELRVPLLDHRILEFAASLPPVFKVRGRETKRILKAAFAKTLPEEVLKRKKAGFPVPYGQWLRHGLRNQVMDVILSERAVSRNYFQKRELQRLLETGSRSEGHSKEIFSLLVLELWHQQFLDNSGAGAKIAGSLPIALGSGVSEDPVELSSPLHAPAV